jgi:tRNA-dihydrouridine synthase
MAPLAGYTSYPFRMMCTELGVGLCFTEMVSCNGNWWGFMLENSTLDKNKTKAGVLSGFYV